MLTLDEIRRYYSVKKYTFLINRNRQATSQSVLCIPTPTHERIGFRPFDRLELKTGKATLITYENEFFILEDSATTPFGLDVPPLMANQHGIKKIEDDGFVHPSLIPTINIFDINKPFFGYNYFGHFPEAIKPWERDLVDLSQKRSDIADLSQYRAKLDAQIEAYKDIRDHVHDYTARVISKLRLIQLDTKLHELDQTQVAEVNVREQSDLEKEVIKIFLVHINASVFFEYVHLKATLSVAEISMMEQTWELLNEDLKRRLGNETHKKELRDKIFRNLFVFTRPTPAFTYFDYLLKEKQFILANDEAKGASEPKTAEGQTFVDFYTTLGSLAGPKYPQRFCPYQSAKTLPDAASDLDVFYYAEGLFFNFLAENIQNKEDLNAIEERYRKVSPKNQILFLLSRIRLLQIKTLTVPMSDELIKLKHIKGQLLQALEKLGTAEAFNELFGIYKDPSTPPNVRNQILGALWNNIEKVPFQAELIETMLDKRFTPSEGMHAFTTKCTSVIETFCPVAQARLKGKILENYSFNRATIANQFYVEKNWDEALRWANFLVEDCDGSLDSLTAAALEPYARISEDVTDQNHLIRNKFRYYLFRYALESNDTQAADYYGKNLDRSLLDAESVSSLTLLESDFKDSKYRQLYKLAKGVESHLRLWLSFRSFEYFELFLRFQQLFQKFNGPDTDECGQQLEEFKNALIEIIGSRWSDLQNSQNSYIHDNISSLNVKFIDLATAIDSDRRYHILMPTLTIETDPNNIAIKDLQLGQFVLTSDKKYFIPLESLFVNMISRIDQGECNKPIFPYSVAYFDHRKNAMSVTEDFLSEAEVKEIFVLVPQAPRFLATAEKRLAAQKMTALKAFQELRAALRRGDISEGKDLYDFDAGADSMSAVSNFKQWLESLQSEQRSIIENLQDFREVKNRLFKTLDQVLLEKARNNLNGNPHDCINQIGYIVDRIIERDKEVLSKIICGKGLVEDVEWGVECQQFLPKVGASRVLSPSPDLPVYKPSKKNTTLYTAFLMARYLETAFRNRKDSLGFYLKMREELYTLLDSYSVMTPFEFKHKLMRLKTELMATRVAGMPTRDQYYEAASKTKDKKIFQAIVQHKAFRKNDNDIYRSLLKDPEGTTYYSLKNNVVHCHIGYGTSEERTTLDLEIFVDYTRPDTPFYILVNYSPIYFNNLDQVATEFKLTLLLTKSPLATTFDSFKDSINHPANPPELKANLLNLRTSLVNEAYTGKTTAPGKITKVVTEMNTMISGIHQTNDYHAKAQCFEKCKTELMGESWFNSPLGKAIRPVLTMVAAIVGGFILGAVIGVALGAWLGPGAAATGLAGAIKGGLAGAKLGVAAGAGFEIYNSLSFWRKPSVDQSVIKTCEAAEYTTQIAVTA